jgi:hypothetical protein
MEHSPRPSPLRHQDVSTTTPAAAVGGTVRLRQLPCSWVESQYQYLAGYSSQIFAGAVLEPVPVPVPGPGPVLGLVLVLVAVAGDVLRVRPQLPTAATVEWGEVGGRVAAGHRVVVAVAVEA